MTKPTRRGLFGMLAVLPLAARMGFSREMAPEVPAEGYTTAGTGETWENTTVRVALCGPDGEISGRGYRRVLAQAPSGGIHFGTTPLRADFPQAETNWGLVDSYKLIDDKTGELLGKGTFSEESRAWVNHGDTVSFDLSLAIFGVEET